MGVLVPGIKLALFAILSLALTVIVSNTVTRPLNHPTNEYSAVFSDASGLRVNDDVDIAGVRVGKVTGEHLRGATAVVTFEVVKSQPLNQSVRAIIRYQDLLGARFLSLVQATPHAAPLKPGATIPRARTASALSLTALFNGFKPLFSALSPKAANELAANVIAAVQGEGGSVVTLLRNVATLTSNLSHRDAVIAAVIDNFDSVLGTVATHHQGLATLISRLTALTSGLSADRQQIGAALSGVDDVARSLSGLVHQANPSLHHDIGDLYAVAGTLVAQRKQLDAAVRALPTGTAALTRSFGYGSWINNYLCSAAIANGSLIVPVTVGGVTTNSAVCR